MSLSPPAHPELQQLFSVSSALQAAAGAAAVKIVSGLVVTSVGLAAPSGEQAVSLVHVAAAEEPKKVLVVKETKISTHEKIEKKIEQKSGQAWHKVGVIGI